MTLQGKENKRLSNPSPYRDSTKPRHKVHFSWRYLFCTLDKTFYVHLISDLAKRVHPATHKWAPVNVKQITAFMGKLLLDLCLFNAFLFVLWKGNFIVALTRDPVWSPVGPWLLWQCWKKLAAWPLFRPLDRCRLTHPAGRLAWIVVDALALNILMFLLVQTAVFMPLGLSSGLDTALWASAGLFLLWFSHGVMPWREKPMPRIVLAQAAFFGVIVLLLYALSTLEAKSKGTDFSFLRVETIKTPHWFHLLGAVSPIYTVLFITLSLAFIYWIIRHPKTPIRFLVPGSLAAFLYWLIHDTFAGFSTYNAGLYTIIIAGPTVVFTLFLFFRSYAMGLRMVPFVYYTTLLLFNYTGTVPLLSDKNALLAPTPEHISSNPAPLAKRLYPAPGEAPDPSLLFMRKLVKIDDFLYTTFGPTCGVYRFDINEPHRDNTVLIGLVRDISVSPKQDAIWGINWMQGDFFSLNATTMEMNFQFDLFEYGLRIPWRMEVRGNTVFIANVTPPAVGVLEINPEAKGRDRVSLKRRIDFRNMGYTPFSDGAYGIYVDDDHERIYVTVGFLDKKFLLGLVELDLDTLAILRDVRVTAGDDIFPVQGRRTLLLPSYYTNELHEVDLDTMQVIRTMEAGPNLVELQQDTKRGLFYGVSRSSGVLQVIDDKSGQVVREVPTGPKPEPLLLDAKRDVLYVGSGGGIFEIPLDRLTHGL